MKTSLFFKAGLAVFAFILYSTITRAYTAVASGNWSNSTTWGGTAPGGTISGQDILIPNGITVNLDMDVSFSGLSNAFTVNGSLANGGITGVALTQGSFAGAGNVTINRLTFSSLAVSTFTGNINVNLFENRGATLSLTALISITDTLNLDAGNLLLSGGANIILQTGSVVRVNDGTLSIHGGVFTNTNLYDVVYVGTSKTTGIELNTLFLNHLYIRLTDNSQTLTLGTNLQVNGPVSIATGTFDFSSQQVSLLSNVMVSSGAFLRANSTSSLSFQSGEPLTSVLYFSSGSALQELSINLSNNGQVKLYSPLTLTGNLNLLNGHFSLESGGILTVGTGALIHMESGILVQNGGSFNGTASYDVEYRGGSLVAGSELTGSGLHNLTVSLNASADNRITLSAPTTTVGGMLNLAYGKLDLSGYNLVLNGTFQSSAMASFIGHVNSELDLNLFNSSHAVIAFDPSNQNLKTLKLQIASGGVVSLGSALTINSLLELGSGLLDIADNDLLIQGSAAISGSNDMQYIITSGVGRLFLFVSAGSKPTAFPVGTASGYAPALLLQQATGSSSFFMLRVSDGVYAQGVSGFNSASMASVVNHTWFIEAASGASVNMTLQLGWTSSAEVNGFDRTHSYISHYTNARWDTYATASASTGLFNTYVMERSGITSLSPFTVADNQAALGIPEASAPAFRCYPVPASDELNIELGVNGVYWTYEVLDITGKIQSSTISNLSFNRIPVGHLPNGTYLLRISNPVNHQVIVKRFIKIG
ncbi:MAG TPA: T9SS type A sorting domain-containing protein [Bacteroidia bacterium]|jgi:hypothetical protein|nr:T9SS type A sorting domain-containing protein [Bacteroidia bacterium]